MNAIPMILALALVAGCAKQPEAVAALNVSSKTYSGLSCSQLSAEAVTAKQRIAALSAKQKSAATGDAMGVFLLGLPVSSMSGNDSETALAYAKGQADAIDRVRVQRGCR